MVPTVTATVTTSLQPPAPSQRGGVGVRVACTLVGGVLLADALWLMAQGFFMLGVTVPGAMGLALCVLAVSWHRVQAWLKGERWGRWLWRAGWLLLAAWVVSVAVFWAWLAQQVRGFEAAATTAPVKAIVVLGNGTPNGQPSPALRARLERLAARVFRDDQQLVAARGVSQKTRRNSSQIGL